VRALRDGVVGEDRRTDYLAQIERQTLILSALVDQLHSLAREHAGDAGSMRECVAPQGAIEAAVETMRIQAEVRGVTLKHDLPSDLPSIYADPMQLQRGLLNLIENAIRHAHDGGNVLVRVERTLSGVEIEVEDDGDGIAAEERDHVFVAFHGDDRRRSPARSGLGLAIARAAVEAHGGRIWLGESGYGTRVRLSLPAPREHACECADAHASRPQF
jgi:signal transduction histidine kinase